MSTFTDWAQSIWTVLSTVNNAACVHHYIHLKYTWDVSFYHEPIWQVYTFHSPYVPFEKKNGLFAKPVKIRSCSLKTVAERLRGCLLGCMYRQGESFSTSVVSHVQRGSPPSPDPTHTPGCSASDCSCRQIYRKRFQRIVLEFSPVSITIF